MKPFIVKTWADKKNVCLLTPAYFFGLQKLHQLEVNWVNYIFFFFLWIISLQKSECLLLNPVEKAASESRMSWMRMMRRKVIIRPGWRPSHKSWLRKAQRKILTMRLVPAEWFPVTALCVKVFIRQLYTQGTGIVFVIGSNPSSTGNTAVCNQTLSTWRTLWYITLERFQNLWSCSTWAKGN